MNKKTDNMDVFDSLFEQIQSDSSSLADFGDVVRQSMDEAARKKGYDTFSEMISSEISSSITKEKPQKPTADTRNIQIEELTRFEYMMKAIESVTYEPKYQGYYGTGHRSCLDGYVDKMEANRDNMCVIEAMVKADMRYYSKQVRKNRNDAYTQGYYDALVLLANSLLKSKKAKMREIKKIILEMKETSQ